MFQKDILQDTSKTIKLPTVVSVYDYYATFLLFVIFFLLLSHHGELHRAVQLNF